MKKQLMPLFYRAIQIVIAISIPYIIFLIAKYFNDNRGAAEVSNILKDFGFRISMDLGLRIFFIMVALAFIIYEYCLVKFYINKLEKDIKNKQLDSVAQVLSWIENYNISTLLKSILKSKYL